MRDRWRGTSRWLACAITAWAAWGCQVPVRDVAPGADPEARAARLERRARHANQPVVRARLWTDAAEIHLEADDATAAKACLDRARKAHYEGEIADRIHLLLGAAYMGTGEIPLAERYLLKGLRATRGEARDETLARLATCARARGAEGLAKQYESEIAAPHAPRVARILRDDPKLRMPERRSEYLDSLRAAPPSRTVEVSVAPPPTTPLPSRAEIASTSLRPLPRSAWNARAVRTTQANGMQRVRRITVHHTAGDAFWGRSRSSVAAHIQSLQRYHQRNNGWADIGYHWLIDRGGTIWQGRELRYQGAHVRQNNSGNIGIALIGNYERQQMTTEQQEALARLVAFLAARYGVPSSQVYTHGEIVKTACPGADVQRYVASLRSRLTSQGMVALGK